jgi:hypothetical protein
MSTPVSAPPARPSRHWLLCLAGLLALLLAGQFRTSFKEGFVVFANDGPLGAIAAQAEYAPGGFTGFWQDLYWLGGPQPSALPNVTQLLFILIGPGLHGKDGAVLFAKFYVPITMLVLGLAVAVFCRGLGFKPLVCALAGLAAAGNMNAFSNACWGLPTWSLTWAMNLFAMAAIVSPHLKNAVVRCLLAGFGIGLGVMEGYDVGAIFSLYVAAFALFFGVLREQKPALPQLGRGVVFVALMAGCAAWISAQALDTLVGTQIKGVAGTQQDDRTKEQRWDFATSGSLPKIETLRVLIPGLYGYRMDSPDGGQYWGAVNRGDQISDIVAKAMGGRPGEREQAQQALQQVQGNTYAFRHSGSGEYAGVLVVLLALWAITQSFRGNASSFSAAERRMVWFWAAAALVSLLLAFGRHAPFYQFVYQLPYFSTIRNPIKFMQPFHVAMLILFAHGLEDLCRRYLSKAPSASSLFEQLKRWWASAPAFERRWTAGLGAALGAAVLATLVFASSRGDLLHYLQLTGFTSQQAPAVADFALRELFWFILFLALAGALTTMILSGALGGKHARWAGLALGLLLVADLSRANSPWIIYENHKEKYQSNAIIDLLRERSHEHRVAIGALADQIPQLSNFYGAVYHHLWLQHHFPYYNVQSLDIPQEPRVPQEKLDYRAALGANMLRYWQLTNTRYLFGLTQFQGPQGPLHYTDLLNQLLDPVQRRFKVKAAFNLVQDGPDKTPHAVIQPNGQYALIEFTGALPRAKLYAQWQAQPDLSTTLTNLASPAFDPEKVVLVSGQVTAPDPANAAVTNAGTVEIVSYAPKHVRLKADAKVPSMLLLNDRYHPDWKVWVDGQPAELLRANYIVRGVMVPAGAHEVEFKFQPSVKPLYVSLSAIAVGLVLCGFVCFQRGNPGTTAPVPTTDKPDLSDTPPAAAKPADKDKSSGGKRRKSR